MTDAEFEKYLTQMETERLNTAEVDAGYEAPACPRCLGRGKARNTRSHTHGTACTACDGTGKAD